MEKKYYLLQKLTEKMDSLSNKKSPESARKATKKLEHN